LDTLGLVLLLRWLWLVLTSAKQEGSNHVPHQVLISQSNNIKVNLPKVLGVGKHGCK
jgi:hypothetical protein